MQSVDFSSLVFKKITNICKIHKTASIDNAVVGGGKGQKYSERKGRCKYYNVNI